MRFWQLWWRNLVFSIQYDPPGFVEYLMISFSLGLGLKWLFSPEWPYLVLSSSFAIGAAISMWVRQVLIPSPHPRRLMIFTIVVLLLYSLCALDAVRLYL